LDETLLDADYLFAFLQTNHFIDAISGHEQSLGVPNISPGQVETVGIPMPPIEEQRRISTVAKEILNTTNEALVAANAMLANISILPSRLLAQAFDCTETGENP
jgi:type I restriction enzyme S subunit